MNGDLLRRTLRLAERGRSAVSPNPRVGAIITSPAGEILAEGWHHHFGGDHAEIDALKKVPSNRARGGKLYVNLEPCCHYGHTPPCVDAIIQAGIRKAFVCTIDPNPKVNGEGIKRLIDAGIEVSVGGRLEEALDLNRGYFSWMKRRRAWCEVKVALSLDGKMADYLGRSKWISSAKSLKLAHKMRADCDGVLVGAGTLQTDDPELTVRHVRGKNPARLLLSTSHGLPGEYKLSGSAGQVRTILLTGEDYRGEIDPHVEVVRFPTTNDGKIDPISILTKLPELGICSLLIEGGSGVISSFMDAGVIDRITVAYCPSVVGKGIGPFDGFTPPDWGDRPKFKIEYVTRSGADVIVRYQPESAKFLQD